MRCMTTVNFISCPHEPNELNELNELYELNKPKTPEVLVDSYVQHQFTWSGFPDLA